MRRGFENLYDGSLLQYVVSELSYRIALERVGRVLIKSVIWRGNENVNRIALTFDDGPNAANTPAVLDILDRFQIHATFFVIGKYVQAHPELAVRIAQAGHEIGNHTHSHLVMPALSDRELTDEILRAHALIGETCGHIPRFLRPPMGLFSKRVLLGIERSGYQTVVGDVYPRDPHLPGKEKIVKRVLHRTQAGSIIILHDGGNTEQVDRRQTIEAVKEIIPRLRDRGFEFVKLSELISQV